MDQFVNKKESIVTEAVDGLVAASGGKLARLNGYPHIRVVIRNDWDKSKVALVSGGGSGHEPSHAGFVGQGMLTAAICGDVFASPSVDAVLAGILAVTGPKGCLLIVKNYTGDRLNFGLAAERARALGIKVSMVIVNDDIALPDLPQPRGIAGTLFVHKIAGALADEGADLDNITIAANRVIANVKTIGMSLDTCTIPGSPKDNRIPDGVAELGLGIHGEAGIEQIAYQGAKDAVSSMINKLNSVIDRNQSYIALLNNLGGTSVLEMSVILHELCISSIGNQLAFVIGPTTMMTSLDMRGFSISIYPEIAEDVKLLNATTHLSTWPGLSTIKPINIAELPNNLKPQTFAPSDDTSTRSLLTKCCNILIAAEGDLNALDAKSGDGDTGSTFAKAAHALLGSIDQLPLADHTQLLRAIGIELNQTMGGSSGVLLAIFFAAAGDGSAKGLPIIDALKSGLKRLQEIGGANIGDRTLIDALAPALDNLSKGLPDAANAARVGANHTATISRAKAGRAAYISSQQLEGNVDPGAEAVARLFENLV